MSQSQKIAKFVKNYSGKKWYAPAAGGIVSFDYFIPVLPSTTLVIASALLQPKNWLKLGFFLALGSALGGIFVCFLIQSVGSAFIENLFSSDINSEGSTYFTMIKDYGHFALFALACIPIPVRAGTVIASVSGVYIGHVAIALLLGRLIAYVGLSFLVSRFPTHLLKIGFVKRSPFITEVLTQK